MLQTSLSKNYGQQFVSRILLFQSSHCLSLPYFLRRARVSGATLLIQMRKWQNLSLSEASLFSTLSTAGVEEGETNTCLDKKLLQKTMTKQDTMTFGTSSLVLTLLRSPAPTLSKFPKRHLSPILRMKLARRRSSVGKNRAPTSVYKTKLKLVF